MVFDYFSFWPAERTEKIPMGSIKNVVTEPIEGHEDYHMMVRVYRNIFYQLCIVPVILKLNFVNLICYWKLWIYYLLFGAAIRHMYACLFVCHPRHFSWVRQKPHNIGSTGCLHSLLMQSKTQFSENGSIFNVPL